MVKDVVFVADLGRWADTELSVLYDIFYETGTRLMGAFVALRYAAHDVGDEEQVEFWTGEVRRVRDARQSVDSNDRAAIVAMMDAFNHELRYINYARGVK